MAGALHVTLKIRADVGNLRTQRRFLKIKRAFRYGCDQFGMRLAHFSVQGDHIHLIVEAQDQRALARGMQGLAICIARAINRVSEREGKVFADRYHCRALRSPREVRNAVHYVLYNRQKHLRKRGQEPHPWDIDEFSSASGEACWHVEDDGTASLIICEPVTWLLKNSS